MRKTILTFLLLAVIVFAGCKALDNFYGYDYDHDRQLPGPSQADEVTQLVRPLVDTTAGAPWGEIIGGLIAVIGGGYVLVRRIQRRIKKNNVIS